MKVIVLHDNPDWFSSLAQAFHSQGLEVEEWLADEITIDVMSPPPNDVIVYNRTCASAHTRGRERSLDHARTIVRWLEQHEIPVINGMQALELENSKAWQYMSARMHGLKVRRSIFTAKPSVDQIEREIGKDTPFLIKPDRGGRGASVRMYQNADDFRQDPNTLMSPTGLYVIQEHIPTDTGVYRAEFVGLEHIYTSLAKPQTSCSFDPNMCPCELPSDRFHILSQFQHSVLDDCQNFLRETGLEVSAFEFIFDWSGQPHVIDINTITGYNMAAERKAGVVGGVEKLANYVARKRLLSKQNARAKNTLHGE